MSGDNVPDHVYGATVSVLVGTRRRCHGEISLDFSRVVRALSYIIRVMVSHFLQHKSRVGNTTLRATTDRSVDGRPGEVFEHVLRTFYLCDVSGNRPLRRRTQVKPINHGEYVISVLKFSLDDPCSRSIGIGHPTIVFMCV